MEFFSEIIAFLPRLLLATLVIAGFFYLGKYLGKLVTSILSRTNNRDTHDTFFSTLFICIGVFIGLVISLNILGLEKAATSLLAGGGVTAIVIGFAFREIGENLLAGIFLAFSRPFKTGDAIKTEDITGTVQSIELRYTHLRSGDGRDIYVPSSQLFSKPVSNFTRDGLRRFEFVVGIDYSNDSKQACALLRDTVKNIDGVLENPESGAYMQSLAPQYVELIVFFWVDTFNKNKKVAEIRTDVMDACRVSLLQGNYTVSADTTSNIAVTNRSE